MLITSVKNQRISAVLALGKARDRKDSGCFALEGAREIERALACGYKPKSVFWCQSVLSSSARRIVSSLASQVERFEVSEQVYAKIAVRESSDGLVLVFEQKHHDLTTLPRRQMRLILAVQGLEKPGNLGAILRSSDAAGADALFLIDQQMDLYNPLVLRASLGTAFSQTVVAMTSADLRRIASEHGWQIVAAALHESAVSYASVDYTHPTVILLGTESDGLTENWLQDADSVAQIPMAGIADSLNVSVAGAVMLFEARRQISLTSLTR